MLSPSERDDIASDQQSENHPQGKTLSSIPLCCEAFLQRLCQKASQIISVGIWEAKPSASSKMMLNWLKTESPKKEGGAPESPERPPKKQQEGGAKRGSEGLMQAWLRKAESCEPVKKPRTH
ncbi:UNVERIFIED_CONTAM: hypothetical protein FKN15_074530 [Acipenser sinensis]